MYSSADSTDSAVALIALISGDMFSSADSAVSADQRLSAKTRLVSADRDKNSADLEIAISRLSAEQRLKR